MAREEALTTEIELTLKHVVDCDESWAGAASGHITETTDIREKQPLEAERSSQPWMEKSVWTRIQLLKPSSISSLVHQDVIRTKTLEEPVFYWGPRDVLFTILWISCCWVFCGLQWSCTLLWWYATRDEADDNFTNQMSSPTVSTPSPTYFIHNMFKSDGRGIKYLIAYRTPRYIFFIPITWTIFFYFYTSLTSTKGRMLWLKITVIHLLHLLLTISLWACADYFADEPLVLTGSLVFLMWFMLYIMWILLARFLNVEWCVNIRWLLVLLMCYVVVYTLSVMPSYCDTDVLKSIYFYIPLFIIMVEKLIGLVLSGVFHLHKKNNIAINLSILDLLTPLEVLRFVSFAMAYIQFVNGGRLKDMVLNIIFSIMGEIYVHTQMRVWFKYQWQIRCYGRRLHTFSKLYDHISACRSYIEYVAPVMFYSNALLTNACRNYIPITDDARKYLYDGSTKILIENMYPVLGLYYLIELVSELLCWLTRHIWSYERKSAIRDFKWPLLLVMIVLPSMQIDGPLHAIGFLRILN